MKFAPLLAAGAVAITALAVVPTASATVTDAEIAAVRSALITPKEAAKLGVTPTASAFTVFQSRTKSAAASNAHNVWLCDTPSGVDSSVPSSPVAVFMAHTDSRGEAIKSVQQQLYKYPSAAAAKRAYKQIKAEASKCTGSVSDTESGNTVTQSVSNGVSKVKDGDEVVWTLSSGDISGDQQAWISHDYNVYHVDGTVISVIQIDLDGPGVPAITAKQRTLANELVCDSVHRA